MIIADYGIYDEMIKRPKRPTIKGISTPPVTASVMTWPCCHVVTGAGNAHNSQRYQEMDYADLKISERQNYVMT